jgi:hypothetical protein
MFIFVQLLVAVCAGISMYFIVERHNARSNDPFRYLEPISSGVLTALLGAVAAPYLFYKMRGPIGIVYGIGFVVGMSMSAGIVMVALSFVSSLIMTPSPFDALSVR